MYNTQKSNLIEKTITLANVEDTGTQYKITDEANNFYSFFKNKKVGGLTQAAVDLQAFQLGQQVNVVYEERPGSQGGTFRNVARIKPAGGEVTTSNTFNPPSNVPNPFQPVPAIPTGLPNTGFGLTATPPPSPLPRDNGWTGNPATTLPRDLSITAQAFAKSLLESNQATPQDLVNPQWWSTVIFPAIQAMIAGGSAAVPPVVEDISVEDIPF
jgi:hypothetical protein